MDEKIIKELTVSEFARELNVSVNTAWDKIKKFENEDGSLGLLTTKKPVNNRDITFVKLNEYQHNKLFGNKIKINSLNEPVNNPHYEESLRTQNPVNNPERQLVPAFIVEKIIDEQKRHDELVNNLNNRVNNAEKQVYLLEKLDTNKDSEINQLRATVKEMEIKINELQKVNEDLNKQVEAEKNKKWYERLRK